MIDFAQLGINSIQKQIKPRDIFMALTEKDNKYQYPRDVQGEVWKQWFDVRENKDTIIKMNTGSGKTLVALLILQSCLNEGVGPALYVVPDKYLVEQVISQAKALGIKVTDTENDLAYQRKKAILVIGIQKLVNGKSIFGLRKENNYSIGSVVIDDMHACISCIQEQFSITVPRNNILYKSLTELFWDDMNKQAEGRFSEIINSQNTFDNMMVPFWAWQEKIAQVYQILSANKENDVVKFKFDLIKDCLKLAHCYISTKEVSIIPNCTPIQKITSFDEGVAEDFKAKYLSLKEQGIKGLVIDLRDNGGGLVAEALKIVDYIVPKDQTALITVDKEGKEEISKTKEDAIITEPIVLLVNSSSASASEIMAGALKDLKCATIVGTKTYGKGVIQQLLTLSNGAGLKITVEEYYTPNKTKINKVGITPDYEILLETSITREPTDANDTQLNKAKEILKAKIEN